jgi:hypothetical protein
MSFDEEAFFVAKTPLNVEVRTTTGYWEYLVTKKHPLMKGKEDMVKAALQFPDEIRQSKTDKDVFLYYNLNLAILNTILKDKPFWIPVFTGMTFSFIGR